MKKYVLIVKLKTLKICDYIGHKVVEYHYIRSTIFIGNCIYDKHCFKVYFGIIFTKKLKEKYNIIIVCNVPTFDTEEDAERFFQDKIYHKIVLNTLKGGAI